MNPPVEYNFIVVKLGDNDFGNTIREALIEGVEYWGLDTKACPIIWKKFIIAHLIGHNLKRRAVDTYAKKEHDEQFNEHINFLHNDYFEKGLRVTFEVNAPTDDHDGGSAAYDIHRKYAWTF